MKKRIVLLAIVLLALYNNPSAKAQEIRLDSLWAKQGGVFAMSFSPDSKALVIGEDGDEGQIRIFEAQTGKEIDSIAHSDFVDMQFTTNGKQLMVIDRTAIKFYNSTTYKLERTIQYDQGGLITFSSNGLVVALAGGSSITIFDIERGEVLAKLSRPYQYYPDPQHPFQTEYYHNGKVSFSADGKYVIGKYENSIVRWDWQNAPTKPEILIGDIGNRAIIGFSPDGRYLVQQTNYIWDITERKQVLIEGIEPTYHDNNNFAVFSIDNKYLFCFNSQLQVNIVNLEQKKILYNTEKGAKEIAVSNDNQYLSYRGVGSRVRTFRIIWNPNSVQSEPTFSPEISITPQPGKELVTIEIEAPYVYLDCNVSVTTSIGSLVRHLFKGTIPIGKQTFMFPTAEISSGQYSVVMSYGGRTTSVPFIITK